MYIVHSYEQFLVCSFLFVCFVFFFLFLTRASLFVRVSYFMFCVCIIWLLLGCQSRAIHCLERLVSEMTYRHIVCRLSSVWDVKLFSLLNDWYVVFRCVCFSTFRIGMWRHVITHNALLPTSFADDIHEFVACMQARNTVLLLIWRNEYLWLSCDMRICLMFDFLLLTMVLRDYEE